MAITEASAKRFEELRRELRATYFIVLGILARLPVPMTPAPIYGPGAVEPMTGVEALSLAWNLMDAEPVTAALRGHLRDMITAWLTAAEVTGTANAYGPAIYRNRIIADALRRTREAAARASILLDTAGQG